MARGSNFFTSKLFATIARASDSDFTAPSGHGLDEDVADGGGFDGAGDDGAIAGVGGELIEQFVSAAAANDVDCADLSAEDVF